MIFSSSKSFLLRKRMTEECWNQGYVMIVLNNALLSSIRFWKGRIVGLSLKLTSTIFTDSEFGWKTGQTRVYKSKASKFCFFSAKLLNFYTKFLKHPAFDIRNRPICYRNCGLNIKTVKFQVYGKAVGESNQPQLDNSKSKKNNKFLGIVIYQLINDI